MSREEKDKAIKLTDKERIAKNEKDIEQLTALVQKLLSWKRNQETRILPITQQDDQPDKSKEKIQ